MAKTILAVVLAVVGPETETVFKTSLATAK